MRIIITLIIVGLLSACSDSSPPTTAPPTAAPITTPVNLVNSNVDCGNWQQDLTFFPPSYTLAKQQRWVIMGSSSAFGAGASRYELSWAGQLEKLAAEYGAEVINIARGGYTTYHAMETICAVNAARPQPDLSHNVEQAILKGADIVFLSFPSNDAASNFSAEEAAFNLIYMRAFFAERRIPVVILGSQPRNMSAAKQRLLTELDLLLKPRMSPCFVELYPQLVDNTGNLATQFNSGDGVHLNDLGHALVFDTLKKLLSMRQTGSCFE